MAPESMMMYLRAKAIADEYLSMSEIPFTIVRPGALTDDEGTGSVQASKSIKDKSQSILREDVASVLIASLTLQEAKNQTFEIVSGDKRIEEALNFIQ
ncbi:NAD(P)H-binding protein [Metabacillus herbersteinensis]|uniref:NAD(P)H-binding protein n=1 Tax=Metabacillus herbersteinensis TaxID=283816 RepID=A0ABV6GA97_9BACI